MNLLNEFMRKVKMNCVAGIIQFERVQCRVNRYWITRGKQRLHLAIKGRTTGMSLLITSKYLNINAKIAMNRYRLFGKFLKSGKKWPHGFNPCYHFDDSF